MQVRRLRIRNFRAIADGIVDFAGHTLLVGGNNIGKSTVCEALDLILGPERLYRRPVIDEHDFHCGHYVTPEGGLIDIRLEAILVDLPEEARRRFHRHLRRWNDATGQFIDDAENGLDVADDDSTKWALPLVFIGRYDKEEDDFIGDTFFDHPPGEPPEDEEAEPKLGDGRVSFTRAHKRLCGFVFLRTLRTGSRALSLQRGSLLDSVLKLGGAPRASHPAPLQQAIGCIARSPLGPGSTPCRMTATVSSTGRNSPLSTRKPFGIGFTSSRLRMNRCSCVGSVHR